MTIVRGIKLSVVQPQKKCEATISFGSLLKIFDAEHFDYVKRNRYRFQQSESSVDHKRVETHQTASAVIHVLADYHLGWIDCLELTLVGSDLERLGNGFNSGQPVRYGGIQLDST